MVTERINRPDDLESFVARPARQLGLDLEDWLLSRDLWTKIDYFIEQPAFFEFLKWAEREGLIELRPWRGNWVELKVTVAGREQLASKA